MGEWIFAPELFGADQIDDHNYMADVLRRGSPVYARKKLLTMPLFKMCWQYADKHLLFMSNCLTEVQRHQPRIVGFTTVFQQNVASLALAKRIKAILPEVFIVFGGTNCEGVMGAEMVRQFPFVDAVVSGEGDRVFGAIGYRLVNGSAY